MCGSWLWEEYQPQYMASVVEWHWREGRIYLESFQAMLEMLWFVQYFHSPI
jgi:hypothetical protein